MSYTVLFQRADFSVEPPRLWWQRCGMIWPVEADAHEWGRRRANAPFVVRHTAALNLDGQPEATPDDLQRPGSAKIARCVTNLSLLRGGRHI